MRAVQVALGVLLVASTVIAQLHDVASNSFEKRAEMTYWQNWCIAGGAVLAGVGTFASGIAGIISASSSSSSCTVITNDVKYEGDLKRDAIPYSTDTGSLSVNHTGFIISLAESGFNTSSNLWRSEQNGDMAYHGTLSDGLVYVRNLTLSNEGHLNGVFTTADTESTDKGSLEKRYTWKRNEIQVSYHATGKCHTTADKAKIKNIVEEALYHQSIWKRAAACFTIWYDGTWLGHVKILEMTSGGNVLTEGKEKTCQGKKYVSNTC